MDKEKRKWMANLRKEQADKLFKLIKLEVRHKLGHFKDGEFGYALMRDTYKDFLKIDAEREYMLEHGLLDEEEEDEEEYLPEEEEEKEPGLIIERDMYDFAGKAIFINSYSYLPTRMKEYTDKAVLEISKCNEYGDASDFTVEFGADGRLELDGLQFVWDEKDVTLRLIPEVNAHDRKVLNEHFCMYGEAVLSCDKDYAEEKLSEKCRGYAFKADDEAYYWCIPDRSACTVMYELSEQFFADKVLEFENKKYVRFCCQSYFAEN